MSCDDGHRLGRRAFVAAAAAGCAVSGGQLYAGSPGQSEQKPARRPDGSEGKAAQNSGSAMPAASMPRRRLGRTDQQVSLLGIGCAYFQKPDIGPDDVERILFRALELGVTYLDTAPRYGRPEWGYAETKMGPTIKKIRDKVFLVTKTHDCTYEGTWRLLRQSLQRLQTDYIDLVHLHDIGSERDFPNLEQALGPKGALGALLEAKRKGIIRFIGATGHHYPSRFHRVLDTGEIDVLMNAVNLVVQHVYDFEHKVWARARQEDIGLVAMKVLGGAGRNLQGFRLPEHLYETAIRYALSIPDLSVAVIGIASVSELEQAARTVAEAKPFSPEEAYEAAKIGLELAGKRHWRLPYGPPTT